MRRFALLACCLATAFFWPAVASAQDQTPSVRFVEFEATVNPVTKHRILRAIDDAETEGDSLVLVRLDTPGGLVTSMEAIVKRMLASEVPIVVWVGPSGAHAASAGFFILLAADVATMAPGTRTGAASTVMMGGENREDDVLLKKSNEDLAALIRSISRHRGRDSEAAERAVFDAKAYEEQVALELGLIDLVSPDREALLAALDGREVSRFDGSTVVLQTAGARIVTTEFDVRHRFMELLALPMVAFFLLMAGLGGLYIEFTTPGAVLPGVVGVLCLLLFALSAQALPVSIVGLLLILLGVAMFVLEIKVTSFGMLTFGGIAAFAVGSWMLIDGPIPEMRVPFGVVLPVSLALGVVFAVFLRLVVRAQRERARTGADGLENEAGRVTRVLDPEGKVFVHGELWDAVAKDGPLPEGTEVRVVRVDGMRLVVEPAEGARR